MESSKEKIESQLCDYVEGELDDAQRAEIEQHLAANPHHQALIGELRAASGLLRDLPRVKAPIELNESLCGQLERSSLLDPNDEVYDPARSVNRWPQFTAVAAVLILAAGLAFVVFYVLPPSGGNGHGQIAMDDKGAKGHGTVVDGPTTDRAPQAPADVREKEGDSFEYPDRKRLTGRETPATDSTRYDMKMAAPAAPTTSDVTATGVRMRAAVDDLNVARNPVNRRGMVTAAEVENVRRWMNASLGADNTFFKPGAGNSLYLVVSTTNTAAANGQLAAYFKSNGIQYMEDETRLPALGASATADSRRLEHDLPSSRQFGIKGEVSVGEGSGRAEVEKDKAAAAAGGSAAGVAKNAPTAERGLGADSDFGRALGRGEEKKAELGDGGNKAATEAPTAPAAPAPLARAKESSESRAPAAASAGKPVTTDLGAGVDGTTVSGRDAGRAEAQRVQRGGGAGEPVSPSVIVARMNRRQANELSAALSKQQGQHAELKVFAPMVDDAIKQVATGGAAASSNGTEVGQVAQAAPDAGDLTLKQEVRGGAKPAAGEHVLAEHLAELTAKSPADQKPPLSLGAPDAAPATAPVNPTTVAAPGGVASGAAAFRLDTDPLDEPVDVVIVVKKEAAPATAPKAQIEGAP